MRLVYAKQFAIELLNTGKVPLHEPNIFAVVWDLDIPDRKDPLPIPTWKAEAGDWIRPHEMMGPQAAMAIPAVASLVKEGDRIVGAIYVSCLYCDRAKWYWVYAKHGKGGWISELPPDRSVPMNGLFSAFPEIRKDPDRFFSDIPQNNRIPIEELP